MSNARRERQKKDRVTAVVTAAATGDDDARRKAVMNVVQVWLDRLQLISTIVRPSIYTRMPGMLTLKLDDLRCRHRQHNTFVCYQPYPFGGHRQERLVNHCTSVEC